MRKLMIPAILVFCVLLMSAAAQPASAGFDPTPFKIEPILNRVNAAENQLEAVDNRLDDLLADQLPTVEQPGSMGILLQIECFWEKGCSAMRKLVSAHEMYYKGDLDEDDECDYAGALGRVQEDTEDMAREVESHLRTYPDTDPEFVMALATFQGTVLEIVEMLDTYLAELDDDD